MTAMASQVRDKPKSVLVVDDSMIMRQVVSEIVDADPDLRVIDTAENGRIALQKVRQLKPDAVLLDIEMPEMSGIETLRRLGLRSPCKVIVLSSLVTSADAGERVEALRLGAAAVIAKPSGGVSLDLKQKRASEIVSALRQALELPVLVDAPLIASVDPAADLETDPITDLLMTELDTALLLFDNAGRLRRWSTAAERILSGCRLQPDLTTIATFCEPFNQSLAGEIWDVLGGRASPEPEEIDFAMADGNWIPVCRSIRPIKSSGRVGGALVVFVDLSEKRRLQALLNKTMSLGVARSVLTAPTPQLGGELREATVLFADLRGFTSLARELGAPGVVDLLNRYFSYMTDVIDAEGGVVDKFIGDGLMALFGVPVSRGWDADRAVAAVRKMQSAVALLNQKSAAPPLQIGIGISTGEVVAGQIGSPDRMNYTVIGNAANLASRIEDATKLYGAQILICGETRSRLQTPAPMRQVDVVSMRGMEGPTAIHEVFVDDIPPAGRPWLAEFEAGLSCYLDGQIMLAQEHFARARAINPNDLSARVLAQRCRRLALMKPGEWTGHWRLDDR